MHRRILASIAISALALTAAACTNDDTTADPAEPAAPPAATTAPAEPGATAPTEATDEATPADAATPANAEERNANALSAIATAAEEAGGTAYEIDDSDDDGQWEVDVMVENRSHEITVAADGSTVIEREEDDADQEDISRLDQAQVTIEQAIEAALAEVPGSLDDVELSDDNGRGVWEVSIDETENDDVEVYIDIVSGDVVRADR